MKPRLCAALSLLSFLLLFLPSACTIDAYDKGDGNYSNLRGDLAVVTVDAMKQAVQAVTDEGDLLHFSTPFTTSWFQKPDTVYRAYLYYNNSADAVSVTAVGQVYVLRPRIEEDPKTDPVDYESLWLSTNRSYLNATLLLKVGQPDSADARHSIGVMADTLATYPDSTRTLSLTLYHDQGGVPAYYTQRTYVSIPLATLPVDTVVLRINTTKGWQQRAFPL